MASSPAQGSGVESRRARDVAFICAMPVCRAPSLARRTRAVSLDATVVPLSMFTMSSSASTMIENTPMVIAADKFAGLLKKSPRVTRVVDYLFAGVFSAFAIKILTAQAK